MIKFFQAVRRNGGVINIHVVRATAEALMKCNPAFVQQLSRFEMPRSWVQSLYRRILILRHRCSPRSLMLRHQKIYCASLCAAFCWPYGKLTGVEAPSKNDTSRSAGPPRPSFGPLLWWLHRFLPRNRKRAVRFGEGGMAPGVIVATMDHVRIANIGTNTL